MTPDYALIDATVNTVSLKLHKLRHFAIPVSTAAPIINSQNMLRNP